MPHFSTKKNNLFELKVKRIKIDTNTESVAYIHRNCSIFRPDQHRALKKILVSSECGREIFASLAICDDEELVSVAELGLSEQGFKNLGLTEGALVTALPAITPRSLESVRAKIRGKSLEAQDIKNIVIDISKHRYSEMELAAFLIGSASFLSTDELLSLTQSMIDVGSKLNWPSSMVVDKHCIGGIPGNRTSLIVVPIVAAHGLIIPKTSSRSITSPAGTADTMEVFANVDLSVEKIRAVVAECGGCIAWGGNVNLSPADDIMISVQRPLGIDTREQMVASILSKKVAAGSTHLIIDIPVGRSAKVRSTDDAVRLRKLFEFVSDKLNIHSEVIFTDAQEPIGNGVGPFLEARDVLNVLKCNAKAPIDLREKSLMLAGRLIENDPSVRGGQGYSIAKNLLDSGAALDKMQQIIKVQGKSSVLASLGQFSCHIAASRSGIISEIDCYRISRIARLAGAPLDKGAGIDFLKKTNEYVEEGEPVYIIYAEHKSEFNLAREAADRNSGIHINPHR